ncbi:DUF3558 family protein [Pendulispora albinea]|uniref:DUF3558 family protein n=1 Tax=Pendulispora albinea TaxID=2741071 RepID=A0ABZ2LWL3_9BACT
MNRHSLRLGRLAVVGVVALVALGTLGGCGGCGKKSDSSEGASPAGTASASSAVSAGPPGLPDVCKMFTHEQMTALTGEEIKSSRAGEKSTATEPECDWIDRNEGIAVSISLAPAPADPSFKGYEPVPGIGESAIENHGILSVLYRGTEITVIHGGSGHVETQKKIAAKVIEALDKRRQGR